MERKALERLVSALLDEEHDDNRVEAIEEALIGAQLALDREETFDEEDLYENLTTLAIQQIVNKMGREGLQIFRARVVLDNEEEEVIEMVATSNPVISGIIEHTIQQYLKPTSPLDIN